MSTLILDKKTVNSLLNMPDTIKAVEQAFLDYTEGKGIMPAKSYLLLNKGDFRAMPAALPGAAGVKWVNVHPQNRARSLPTIMALFIYNDPETGYPLAVMDATEMTAFRTGAAAAIAAKYLARPDSHILGIVGAGRQAYTQIAAHAELFKINLIKVFDIMPAAVEGIIKSFPQFKIKQCPLEEVVTADIICTLTPARLPVVKKAWIRPGTHINAIGADAEGKEELESSILKGSMVVVDDLRQATAGGEINVPIARGLYSPSEIYATLGEIIVGEKPGRKDDRTITIFDSTGVAIEDIAIAKYIYEKAKQGNYPSVEMV
jgi:alanine dehydrogenase